MIKYALSEIKRDPLNAAVNLVLIAVLGGLLSAIFFVVDLFWSIMPMTCAAMSACIAVFWFYGAYSKHKRIIKEQDECKPAH